MKRALLGFIVANIGSLALAAGTAAYRLELVLEAEPSPALASQVAAVEQTLTLLAERGWPVQGTRVRLAHEPFDATRFGAAILLPLSLSPEDNAYLLARAVVLKATAPHPWSEVVADCVAAHLAPPTSHLRREWEAAWQRRLLAGDVERTALLELLWRRKKDAGLRQLAEGRNPWQILGAETPTLEEELFQVALAGLLSPAKLGLGVPPASWDFLPTLGGDATFHFTSPALRWIALEGEAEGLAVLPTRLRQAAARALVLYDDGRFDTLALTPGIEVQLPRMGVRRLVLAVLSLPGDALASFALRELRDYPVRLGEVEVVQQDHTLQLAWEVEEQLDVAAYLVELWGVSATPTFKERWLLPTSGAGPARLLWSWEAEEEPVQVRVYALTRGGVLAKLFTVPSFVASSNQLDQTPQE